jgi:hypothetical protein
MRRVDAVQFVSPVPVFGTGNRFEHFEAPHWLVDIDGNDVLLERVAGQNIKPLPKFRVVGVGFCVAEEERHVVVRAGAGAGSVAHAARSIAPPEDESGAQAADADGPPSAAADARPAGGPSVGAANEDQGRRRKHRGTRKVTP